MIPMNRIIKEFINLTYLDFSKSRLLRELDILRYLPNIVHLNVSNCQSMSTYSLIHGLKHLTNLQVFICNDNYVRVSAYSVYDAVNGLGMLRYISCEQSGNMQPWIVRRVLEQNPNLLTFLFTTYFALATEKSMYEWYEIYRITYPQVTFSHRVQQEIISYEHSSARIQEELKKKKQPSS